jgi:OOP family OmpA-OmpF porin
MKPVVKLVSLSLLSLSVCPVLASPYGHAHPCYLGAEIGGCNLHYEKSVLAQDALSVDDTGLAGRLLAGFDFNQNVGLELGFTLYQKPEFKYRQGVTTDFSQQSLDFLVKLSLPVSCDMNFYAKAGMSYVYRDDAEVINDNTILKIKSSDNFLRPLLGVGMSYGFTPKISGNLGYYRMFGVSDLPDADFYAAGLTFRVG